MGCPRFVVGDPGLRRLRRSVRRRSRSPVARMWPRHRVSYLMAQRTGVFPGLVHVVARTHGVAVVARSPPQRHDRRRTRCRDRVPPTDRRSGVGRQPPRPHQRACVGSPDRSSCVRSTRRRRRRVRPVRAASPRRVGGPRLPRRDRRRACRLCRDGWSRAAAVHGGPDVLRGVADGLLRDDPARRPSRGRSRSSVEHPHGVHESGVPVPVPEHELPRRAPHVSDGAVPEPSGPSRRDPRRSPGAVTVDLGCVSRDLDCGAWPGDRAHVRARSGRPRVGLVDDPCVDVRRRR